MISKLDFTGRLFFVLMLVGNFSCSDSGSKAVQASGFFSLSEYFNSQADSLNNAHVRINKYYVENGVMEKSILNDPDWYTELQPFIKSEIGKPALASEYDSIRSGDWLYYQAKNLNPSVQRIGLRFRGNTPDSVFIIRRVSNFYYTALDTLQYNPSGNFTMSTYNKPVIGKEIIFVLQGMVSRR